MESELEKLRLKVATMEGEMKAIRAENESGWRGLRADMAQSQKQMLVWMVGVVAFATSILGFLITLNDKSPPSQVVVQLPPSVAAPVAESVSGEISARPGANPEAGH